MVTLFKGIFYITSLEEKKKKLISANYFELIVKTMEMKDITNWYFGLESAIKLNHLTHEYKTIDYILNDKLFRYNIMEIGGHKIKFIKIKPELCLFGIIKDNIKYSDIEKTVLDIIYISRNNGLKDNDIFNHIAEYLDRIDKTKIIKYYKYYPKTTVFFIKRLLND